MQNHDGYSKSESEAYIHDVGYADRERLEILTELYDPASRDFISSQLPDNTRSVLEIGCGHGQMAFWFTDQVRSRNGAVVAIDESQAQIDVCLQRREERGIDNIRFIRHDMTSTLDIGEAFDVVYCRFVLAHITNWTTFFENVLALCKDNGSIIIEEPTTRRFSIPHHPSVPRSVELLERLGERINVKFNCAEPLWTYVQNIDVDIEAAQFTQPALRTPRQKSLIWRSFVQIRDRLQEFGLATSPEIEALYRDLRNVAEDDGYLLEGVRIFHLHLRKRPPVRN
ncbi:class I SAM-dependent methyltransferase [Methylosinus sp. C49]|uniref:class I SAM-dependent methyltransferase n=1 Tax=Methylosinus sp. C49 TaxID=2699395 RepID=UPI00137B2CE3|nr:class I SAM-dependent methyltransferase [Methylosinus sp. C49]